MTHVSSVSMYGNPMSFDIEKDGKSGIFTYISESEDTSWCLCARVIVNRRNKGLYVKHVLFSIRGPLDSFDGGLEDYQETCPGDTAFLQFRDRFFGPDWTIWTNTKVVVENLYHAMIQDDSLAQVDQSIHMEVAKYLVSSCKDVTIDQLFAVFCVK